MEKCSDFEILRFEIFRFLRAQISFEMVILGRSYFFHRDL